MVTKNLITLLMVEIVLQTTILALSISLLFIPMYCGISFPLFFFGLGGIQLVSYLLHINRRLKNDSNPTGYTISLVSLAILGLLTILLRELLFLYLAIMFFAGIIMAIGYLIITINEFKKVDHEK